MLVPSQNSIRTHFSQFLLYLYGHTATCAHFEGFSVPPRTPIYFNHYLHFYTVEHFILCVEDRMLGPEYR